jgi:hypothetical protein
MNKIDIIELKNTLSSIDKALHEILNILKQKQDKENRKLEKSL